MYQELFLSFSLRLLLLQNACLVFLFLFSLILTFFNFFCLLISQNSLSNLTSPHVFQNCIFLLLFNCLCVPLNLLLQFLFASCFLFVFFQWFVTKIFKLPSFKIRQLFLLLKLISLLCYNCFCLFLSCHNLLLFWKTFVETLIVSCPILSVHYRDSHLISDLQISHTLCSCLFLFLLLPLVLLSLLFDFGDSLLLPLPRFYNSKSLLSIHFHSDIFFFDGHLRRPLRYGCCVLLLLHLSGLFISLLP